MRIGIVAACGFRYSPVFQWERPYHERYPEDTLLSYRQEFSEVMKNPEFIVLVAVDKYDPEESKKSEAIIPPNNGAEIPSEGEEVVVGIGCWKLETGSKRVGQFQNDTGDFNDRGSTCFANLTKNHTQIFQRIRTVIRVQITQAVSAQTRMLLKRSKSLMIRIGHSLTLCSYFKGHSTMEMVVVHPAYWKRGHGSRLIRWGMQLADIDHVKQGVVAAKMGAELYNHLGYKLLTDLHWDGDEETPDGLTVSVMEYSGEEPGLNTQ
jgi:GNAT superfamily N-acetyltransferase